MRYANDASRPALNVSVEASAQHSSASSHSSLVTKHSSWRGDYARLFELRRGGIVTMEPETGKVTNEWLFSDVLAVFANGARLVVTLASARSQTPLLCCLPSGDKLQVSFASAENAAAVAHNIQQSLVHGYDAGTVRRQHTASELPAPPGAQQPAVITGSPVTALAGTEAAAASQPQARATPVASAPAPAPTPASAPAPAPAPASEPPPADPSAELERLAAAQLQDVLEGSRCLSGQPHEWRLYEGQRGIGKCCERCFMCQDSKRNVLWRISPALTEEAAMAGEAAVLAAWRAELDRVTSGGGCIAGGEHAWLDSNMTMLRLSEPAHCCKQCGVVKNVSGKVVVLPNMLGHFGPPTFSGYRGDGAAQEMVRRELQEKEQEAARISQSA